MNRDQIAEVIWVVWVRETGAGIAWADAHLYAPEDARCVEACADAIMALDGWQTIDSAPRDGTRVLLYGTRWQYDWAGERREPKIAVCDCTDDDGWAICDTTYYTTSCLEPVAWRPLPPPPGDAG